MSKKAKDLTGQKFERLTVLRRDNSTTKECKWICECNCENHTIKSIRGSSLCNGLIKSCGCLAKELAQKRYSKTNKYDLTGEYGIGWTTNTNKEFYFDLEDYDKIKNYAWYENSNGYIIHSYSENGKTKTMFLHRFILNEPNKLVDHDNRKRYDNKKENLRLADDFTNRYNSNIRKNNKSGVCGVYFSKYHNKWIASITFHGNRKFLGYFENKEDAIAVRLQAEKDLHKDFGAQKNLYEKYIE